MAIPGGDAARRDARPVAQGGLRASRSHAGAVRLLEAQQGREMAAAGVPAARHGTLRRDVV